MTHSYSAIDIMSLKFETLWVDGPPAGERRQIAVGQLRTLSPDSANLKGGAGWEADLKNAVRTVRLSE